jgi:hypothetical protein
LGYNIYTVKGNHDESVRQKGNGMDEMTTAEMLVRAILELIAKCETLEELRESIKQIVGDKN